MIQSVTEAIEAVEGKRLMVAGDIIFDEYVWVSPRSISREAPLIVWREELRATWAGGAGVVARTAAKLGFTVDLVTNTGVGEVERLQEMVGKVTIRAVQYPSLRVPEKTRYIHNRQKIFKRECVSKFPQTKKIHEIIALAPYPSAILHLDFGYGAYDMGKAVSNKQRLSKCPLGIDVQSRASGALVEGFSCIAPTEEELGRMTGTVEGNRYGLMVLKGWGNTSGYRAVTLGREGSVISSPVEPLYHKCPTLAKDILDPVGAGDHYLLGLVIAELHGLSPRHAGYLASCMAALACSYMGNGGIEKDALLEAVKTSEERWNVDTFKW
jgi:bifunctional ADP-heptose synthase (sugar kinase/adenylyltransferase)